MRRGVLLWTAALWSGAALADDAPFRIHIETENRSVELFRIAAVGVGAGGGATIFESVCRAPCDVSVPPGYTKYVLGGDGVSSTSPFDLADFRSDVTLKVRPGSAALRGIGAGIAALGLVSGVVGGLFWGGSALSPSTSSAGGSGSSLSPGQVGMIGTFAGAGTLGLGILLSVLSGTHYDIVPASQPPADQPDRRI